MNVVRSNSLVNQQDLIERAANPGDRDVESGDVEGGRTNAAASTFKSVDWQRVMVVSCSSAITAGLLAGVGVGIQRGLVDDMRWPRFEDISYKGIDTVMTQSLMKNAMASSVNRAFMFALMRLMQSAASQQPHGVQASSNYLSNERVLICLSALLTTVALAALLTPADRIKHFQLHHGGNMLSAATDLIQQGGVRSIYKGSMANIICAFPTQVVRAMAEFMAGGDKEKEKQISNTLTLVEAPINTFLGGAKKIHNHDNIDFLSATVEMAKRVFTNPVGFSSHIMINLGFSKIAKSVYFFSADQMQQLLQQLQQLSGESVTPSTHLHEE